MGAEILSTVTHNWSYIHVVTVNKTQSPLLNFLYFLGVYFTTEVPGKRAIVKVGQNERVINV